MDVEKRFKQLSSTHGHQAGFVLLAEVLSQILDRLDSGVQTQSAPNAGAADGNKFQVRVDLSGIKVYNPDSIGRGETLQ